MKDLKFATSFLSYHPRKGEPTHFVEKIWAAIDDNTKHNYSNQLGAFHVSYNEQDWTPKRTTIRAGHRLKKGDLFVPKIWTGRPYCSKPIAICEPLEVLEVEDFEISGGDYFLEGVPMTLADLDIAAEQDGFEYTDDFEAWFTLKKGQTFDGQRIRFA